MKDTNKLTILVYFVIFRRCPFAEEALDNYRKYPYDFRDGIWFVFRKEGNFNMKNIRFQVILILASLMVLFAVGGVSAAAVTYTETIKIPYNRGVFVPCAAGGAGEEVSLSGNLLIQNHTSINSDGGFIFETLFNAQDISGIGQTSGDKYQATGMTQYFQHIGSGGLPIQYTVVNNFRIIGQGNGNNSLVHETYHVTVNAKGEWTATVDNFLLECK